MIVFMTNLEEAVVYVNTVSCVFPPFPDISLFYSEKQHGTGLGRVLGRWTMGLTRTYYVSGTH